MRLKSFAFPMMFSCLLLTACGDDDAQPPDDNEVITTVTLEFAPMGGGATVSASFRDADGDGGDPPTIDPINLTVGTYDVRVRFLNELEDPAEEITEEVMDESDQHQVFFTGAAINGPATNNPSAPLTHTYADMDANQLPIGLANRIVAATGTGQLTVTLRHMPPVNDTAVKTAATTDQVKSGGLTSIGGSTDVSVNFTATIP